MARRTTLAVLAAAVAACAASNIPTPVEATDPAPASATGAGPASYGPEHVGISLPGAEVCGLSPGGDVAIAEGTYRWLLRNARCEQQKFATMAELALTLNVRCNHCHAPHPSDPNKESYLADTANKLKAIWMYQTFVQGLRSTDGSPTMCSSCHRDPETGEAVAKILGDPRDPVRTMEWMHEMTARFVTHRGERLRCNTCHQGMAPGADDWLPNMVGEDWLRLALSPLAEKPVDERDDDVVPRHGGGGGPGSGTGGGPGAAEGGDGQGGEAPLPTSPAPTSPAPTSPAPTSTGGGGA